MDTMTITEALAEIKTIGKRITKKREFVVTNLARQEFRKDPLLKDGGQEAAILRERQAIGDLEERLVKIRRAIARANETVDITVEGLTRSMADWLRWRREIAPGRQQFLSSMQSQLAGVRQQAARQGVEVVSMGGSAQRENDVLVNINEGQLASDVEKMEQVLGTLDGLLSLKNAIVTIEV